MEKIFSKPPIYLAIVWLAVKILLYNFYPGKDLFMVGMGLNVLFILIIILLNLKKSLNERGFLEQFKDILKPAGLYILLVGIGIFVYYYQVDPEFIENKIESSKIYPEEFIEHHGSFEAFKELNPSVKEKNLEDFISKKNEATAPFLSPQGQALFSVLSMLMLSTFLTLLFLVVSRKIIGKI